MEKDIKGIDARPIIPFAIKFTNKGGIFLIPPEEQKGKHYSVFPEVKDNEIVFKPHLTDEKKKQQGVDCRKWFPGVKIKFDYERINGCEDKLKKAFSSWSRKGICLTLEQVRAKDWYLCQAYPLNLPMKKRVVVLKENDVRKSFKACREFDGKGAIYLAHGPIKKRRLGVLIKSGNESYKFFSNKNMHYLKEVLESVFGPAIQIVVNTSKQCPDAQT